MQSPRKKKGEALMWANNAAKGNEKLKVLIDKNMVETEALENGNKELQTEFEMIRDEKHAGDIAFELKSKELAALKIKNEELETQVKNELREKLSELENENLKLKDVLYGCCECGMFTCECEDLVNEDDDCSHAQLQLQPSPPPSTSPEEPALLLPSPSPGSFPWTPPPTPPCVKCGGVNFGPSPSSLCFSCIPSLESKTQPNSSHSPSTTPPGTPPRRM